MKQKITTKHFIISVIEGSKVIDLLSGKDYNALMCIVKTKYPKCKTEVMEYSDELNVFVPDVKDHLLMVRRRTAGSSNK